MSADEATEPNVRTAAAIQARQQHATTLLGDVQHALRQMRRDNTRITVRGLARRAGVSRTFLYQNPRRGNWSPKRSPRRPHNTALTARPAVTATNWMRPGANEPSTPRMPSPPPTARSCLSANESRTSWDRSAT